MISFILFSVFFIAPFTGIAGKTVAYNEVKPSLQKTKADLVKDVVAVKSAAHLTWVANSQHGSTRYRDHSITNFIHYIAFSNNLPDVRITKLFVDPYHYHRPIALKLIFPEHYFW